MLLKKEEDDFRNASPHGIERQVVKNNDHHFALFFIQMLLFLPLFLLLSYSK